MTYQQEVEVAKTIIDGLKKQNISYNDICKILDKIKNVWMDEYIKEQVQQIKLFIKE